MLRFTHFGVTIILPPHNRGDLKGIQWDRITLFFRLDKISSCSSGQFFCFLSIFYGFHFSELELQQQ